MTENNSAAKNTGIPLWKPVQITTASETIAARIRNAILDGSLKPGDRLGSSIELAEQFNVSRLTIRDALKKLESLGCVEIKVGSAGGTWVGGSNLARYVDAAAVQLKLEGVTPQEMIEAQLAIECTTAELAAKNATPEEIARLKALLQEAGTKKDDPLAFTEAGMAFHHAVAEGAHNRVLAAQLHTLRYVIRSTYSKERKPEITDRVIAEHQHIADLIEAHDEAGARQAMFEHLNGIRSRACWACMNQSLPPVSAS